MVYQMDGAIYSRSANRELKTETETEIKTNAIVKWRRREEKKTK